MYGRLFVIDGILNTAAEINKEVTKLTMNPEPIFDTNTEDWRAWVEYCGGKTIVLIEEY